MREETKAKRQRKRDRPSRRAAASPDPPAASLIGSEIRCKAGRAVPKRGRPSSRSATRQSRVAQRASRRPARREAAIAAAVLEGGSPSQGPGDLTWSRQTSAPARRRREATAREKPEKLIQGGRRTPNGDPVAAPSPMPAVWRRGPRLENGR